MEHWHCRVDNTGRFGSRAFISCSLAQTEINRKYRRYRLHRNRKLDTMERRRKKLKKKRLQKEYKGQPLCGRCKRRVPEPGEVEPTVQVHGESVTRVI